MMPVTTCVACMPVMEKKAVPKGSLALHSAMDHSTATPIKKINPSRIVASSIRLPRRTLPCAKATSAR